MFGCLLNVHRKFLPLFWLFWGSLGSRRLTEEGEESMQCGGRLRVTSACHAKFFDWYLFFGATSQVFVFGPDKKIWELDKGSATAGDVLGRSYMQRFYEGAVLHDRRKGPSGARGQDSAWVNGREVSRAKFNLRMINTVMVTPCVSPENNICSGQKITYARCHEVIEGIQYFKV